MTDFTAYLRLGVDSRDAVRAEKDLNSMTKASRDSEKSFLSLGGASKVLGASIAGISAAKLAKDLFDISRQTGITEASLRTATGSIENAQLAFGALTRLGTELPETLNDVTTAFTRLVNLGLDPSESAIRSYSNTASAMGKNLIQFVEAVADASTGEFERLKEFGIKAANQGDTIAFRFRGSTTVVKNSADAIEGYLKSIGENEFAGAAAERMKTLDGAVSNLQDTYDSLLRSISKQGIGNVITDSVRTATAAIQELNDQVASGQFAGYFESLKVSSRGFATDFVESVDIIKSASSDLLIFFGSNSDEAKSFLNGAFKDLPQNVRALTQLTTVEIASFVDKVKAYFQNADAYVSNAFKGTSLNTDTLESKLEAINSARNDSITSILQEKEATTQAADETRKYADLARDFYNFNQQNSKSAGDTLGKYKIAASEANALTQTQAKTLKDLNDQITKESYLLGNTSKEIAIQYDLKNKLNGVTNEQTDSLLAAARAFDKYNRANQEASERVSLLDDMLKDINKSFDDFNKTNFSEIENSISTFTDEVGKTFVDTEEAARKSAESIKDSITDALLRGFEDGKSIAENFRDTLQNIFKTLVLKPTLDLATDQISKSLSGIIGTAATKGQSGSGALGALGAAAPYAAVGFAIGGSLISSWNDKQDAKFAKLESAYRQGVQFTGTVLGDANKKSESIANSITNLGDTAASTLDVNYGMYTALLKIQDGIAGVASGFARQLGLSGGLGVGAIASSTTAGISNNASAALLGAATGGATLLIKGIGDLIGGQVGGFIDGVLGSVSKFISSTSKKTIDTGIKIVGTNLSEILSAGTLEAFNYAQIKTTKKSFGITTSTSLKTSTEALNDEFRDQLADVFSNAGSAIEMAAKVFGVNFDPAKLIVDTTMLSLKDLTGDDLTNAIEQFFSSTLDTWAATILATGEEEVKQANDVLPSLMSKVFGAIFGSANEAITTATVPARSEILDKFQRVGEGAFETVIRLATETQKFADYAGKLSINFNLVGLDAVEATQNIAKLSGGFDQLTGSLGTYYQNFFSDSERTSAGLSQIGNVLKTIGVDTVPTSREQFRKLIEAIDLSSESGQEQFATLINLSGAFAQLVPATKEAITITEDLIAIQQKYVQSLKDSASAAYDGLSRSISAEKERISNIVNNASIAKSALDSAISSEKERLKSSLDERVSAINAQADAEKTAQDAINKARIDSLREQQSAVADSIKSMTSLIDDINGTIYDMAVNSDELTRVRRRQAEFEIDTALANARVGRGAGDISEALKTLRQDPTELFNSASDLAFATAVNQNKLAELATLTASSVSDSQKQLDILNAQLINSESFTVSANKKYDEMIGISQSQYDADIAALDATQANAQAQFDKLTGVDSRVLGLNESLIKYNEAILAADFENAQQQQSKLDEQLAKAEQQLNALLGIDNSVLSLKDSVEKFIGALNELNAEQNKDNIVALESIAVQIAGLRDEQRVQALRQLVASETTARNTTSIAYDTVPA